MKNNKTYAFMCLVALQQGCSSTSMDDILPDRKKEYLYSQEIESLEIPPDLTSDSIEQPPEYLAPNSGISSYSELMAEKERIATGASLPNPEVELVESSPDQGAYLEVSEAFPQAWRVIGRAISNVGVEIFDRNRSIGMYYVLLQPDEVEQVEPEEEYDPTNREGDEMGVLSELSFLMGDEYDQDARTEQEYRVKMVEQNGITTVRVMNDAGKPQSDGPGLDLLQRIKERLQMNEGYADKQPEQSGDNANAESSTAGSSEQSNPPTTSQPESAPASEEQEPAKQPGNQEWDQDDYEIPSGDLRG